jgi:hypothetical protein
VKCCLNFEPQSCELDKLVFFLSSSSQVFSYGSEKLTNIGDYRQEVEGDYSRGKL